VIGRLTDPAGLNQALKRSGQGPQVPRLGLHTLQFFFCLPLHIATSRSRTHAQIQQLGDLPQREPQRLRILDKPQSSFFFWTIESIPR
jgi:hypothetical protein